MKLKFFIYLNFMMKYFIISLLLIFITNITDWEDILIVTDKNYYDKYSFKNNWVEEKDWWNYSDVW